MKMHTLSFAIGLLVCGVSLRADQVEMRNGDRYAGHLLSVTNDVLTLQSDVLGTIHLSRGQVANITFGNNPAIPRSPTTTNPPTTAASALKRQAAPPAAVASNAAPEFAQAFQLAGENTNLIGQIQKQFLGSAGPEANDKFNELLTGLMNGSLSVGDIREQAKTAADQLRQLKRDGGAEAGFAVDAYLTVLDHFLQETEAVPSQATNAPAAKPKRPSPSGQESD